MYDLSNLQAAPGSRKNTKRVGRGESSGLGKTSGRGHKGQKARSGGSVRPGFEGGQMPLYRRLPKRGFKNFFKTEYEVVNVKDLDVFEAGTVVDAALLAEKGLIRSAGSLVKLLADGEITKALTIKLDRASKQAIDKISKAGGSFAVKE
ncbi:MAG: 50S ribosomal protein L15 [Deltaproteobacteria bacterium ADurb.Bin510]|nr:MAG: 50S ribosomal protein L15 [Deltaproteobacteria bacterium ADurb.Bin510]